jgi:uncharacterized protein YbjT (DUF2867 family)
MILLCGVSGRVGGAAANYLLSQGAQVRGLSRNPEKLDELRARGMEVVGGDLTDSTSIQRALEGVKSALLVTANSEDQAEQECGFAAAAALSGVGHLVKISAIQARPDSPAPFPRTHYKVEQFIKSLGIRSTILRPGFFMQNLLSSAQSISKANKFELPLGKVRTSFIDTRDVGEVAGRVLLKPEKESKTYVLTGQEMMSFHDVAERMSSVLNREIEYVEQTPEAFRGFIEQVIPSPWHVDALCAQFEQIASRDHEDVTDECQRLLGREPNKIERFVEDYKQAFGG